VLALAHGERELELEVPNPPVALAAGDFGADGVPDIVYTDGDRAYVLLSF
jgi:hypothetical protein